MMSRNGALAGGASGRLGHMPTSIKPSIKKKPAPPRPPQPNINRLQTSMSFNTAQDLKSQNLQNSKPRSGNDLIDFKTPPSSPSAGRRNTVSHISTAIRDPNEWSYRVGASIFYIKSPLKNSASETPVQNPFSPPRPTAQSIGTNAQKPMGAGSLQSNVNAQWSSGTTTATYTTATTWDTPPVASGSNNGFGSRLGAGSIHSQFQTSSSLENNNTIKSNYQAAAASPWLPAGASLSSNASSDRTSNSFSDFGGATSQPRYSNLPVTGKKELTSTLSSGSATGGARPTIIRPANKIVSQASQDNGAASSAHAAVINSLKNVSKSEYGKGDADVTAAPIQRNYYDVPPDEEEEDGDDELNDSSFVSPPMPSEPPPPPPPDVLAVDEWVSSTTSVTDYPDTYSDAGQTMAYAIALYDFTPETEGDLQLQAGDLVYLLRKIDDAWYHGSCGGMEGLFPSNFVNVMVPLPEYSTEDQSQQGGEEGIEVDVLYDFAAETEGDLNLQASDKVKVLGRINEDWLYGEKDGTKGQFPAAFVQPISQELPFLKV